MLSARLTWNVWNQCTEEWINVQSNGTMCGVQDQYTENKTNMQCVEPMWTNVQNAEPAC